MNLLFLSLLYHPDDMQKIAAASKSGMQNQINSYQWAFIEGLTNNQMQGESFCILNSLPVGVFPLQYRKLILPFRLGSNFMQTGGVNLPWVKQVGRRWQSIRLLTRWVKMSSENNHIVLYSLYLPYMQAVAWIKKRFPQVKATVIIADLPNELGISSGRHGLMQRVEYRMGRKRMKLCDEFDGFVLLTEHMAEVLPIAGKPKLVMEGLIQTEMKGENSAKEREKECISSPDQERPVVLYTGTLNRELGIHELLEAFQHLPEYNLWLCGKGDMEKEIKEISKRFSNIRYFGLLSQVEAIQMQVRADLLINPRSGKERFTRYSFPSKTLEYMRSGKPVLCYHLDGIPSEYNEHLLYISKEGSCGIMDAVQNAFAMSKQQREQMGQRAKDFVLKQKNADAQGQKMLQFLRGI